MSPSHLDYQAYTLRLARATTGVWRATLYCAQTGQRWHFADPEQLYHFLRQATAEKSIGLGPPEQQGKDVPSP